jgi:hypothetical protein
MEMGKKKYPTNFEKKERVEANKALSRVIMLTIGD